MNTKTMLIIFSVFAFLAVGQTAVADTNATDSNGLYYVSSTETGQTMTNSDGSTVRLGGKAGMQIRRAHIYSEDNGNTEFNVILETSSYEVNPANSQMVKPVVFRFGQRAYSCSGWVGNIEDIGNPIRFNVHGQDEAEAMAKWLSTTCDLRSPPGYKLYARFVPSKTEFNTNEPVMVKFQLKNLDDRNVIFMRGGSNRGSRDNQYGFRAMYQYGVPVADTGDPLNFGGLMGPVSLDPGKVFEDQIDLKKWFAFDKPGRYEIHGFYHLAFYRPPLTDTTRPWGEIMWSGYASADFTVVVK
jgi:hypothetical protein